jgi:hypothetical protein
MLKTALNALSVIHSRPAQLKRLGSPDSYSPCKLMPSNFFRNLNGPEYTTIRGYEFILPIDSLKGHFAQDLTFSAVPDNGTFKLKFGTNETNDINFDATALDIETELQALPSMSNVGVTGDFSTGFKIIFYGFQVATGLGQVTDNLLTESSNPVSDTWAQSYLPWSETIKKGDRILEGTRVYAIDEIMEMHDLGAQVMAYRVRAD